MTASPDAGVSPLPPGADLTSDAFAAVIDWFYDIQAARIVLNIAELLRRHREMMTGLAPKIPPLAIIEQLLEQTGLSDDRLLIELQRLLDQKPDFAEAWLELGYLHFYRSNHAVAEACFDKALGLPPLVKVPPDRMTCEAQAGFGKAETVAARGNDPAAAAKAYAAAFALRGATAGEARVVYAKLLRRLGCVHEALAEFQAGMRSDVSPVPLPPMPRDFQFLAARLNKRFGNASMRRRDRAERVAEIASVHNTHAGPPRTPAGSAARASKKSLMKLRLVTVVWGEDFTDIFLRITARSLLSSGNLADLAQDYDIAYSVHTDVRSAQQLRSSPIFQQVTSLVRTEVVAFDPSEVDTKNPSSHWILWRRAGELAKQNREIVFFIIPDMLFAVGTLMRWAALFDQGYRAVCMASPQVVLETTLAEIEQQFAVGAGEPITLTVSDIQRLFLRQIHPLMVAMYRDTRRPSRHPDSLLCAVPGGGLVMRVLASQPFCFDLNHFEVNDAFCPLDHLDDIAFEQPWTVCLEPMLKYPDLYHRPPPRNGERISTMGSWIDYHFGPADLLWATQNSRFLGTDRFDERKFRRAELSLGIFVCQVRLTGSIYRVMQALQDSGCGKAAQILAAAHFAGRLRRHWRIKGAVTILAPTDHGINGLPPEVLESLLAPGNERALRDAVLEHVFSGRLLMNVGDNLGRSAATNVDGFSATAFVAHAARRIMAGPIEVDDCLIYVIDRPLAGLPAAQSARAPLFRSGQGILPNPWTTSQSRMMAWPPEGEPIQAEVQSPPTLDGFLAAYFLEADKEDASRAGGLNGHLTVARLLKLDLAMSKGPAGVLVSWGALYHRLYYFKRMLERYADLLGLTPEEMPAYALIDTMTNGKPPLQRAGELYEAARLTDPDHGLASFNLASARALEADPDASKLYQEAARKDPSLKPHAALRLAHLSEAAGDWALAADLYTEAARDLKQLGEWHKNAARCLRRSGRLEEALQHYNAAIDWFRYRAPEFSVSGLSVPPAASAEDADAADNDRSTYSPYALP